MYIYSIANVSFIEVTAWQGLVADVSVDFQRNIDH